MPSLTMRAKAKPTRPPNLRKATGKDRRCGTCAWFRPSQLRCAMFGGYRVEAGQVCDDYEKGKPGTKG